LKRKKRIDFERKNGEGFDICDVSIEGASAEHLEPEPKRPKSTASTAGNLTNNLCKSHQSINQSINQ